MIKENLELVKKKMGEACSRSERAVDDVSLICVSKTKPVEMIREAYELGEREFGENKAQEMKEKYELLPKDIHWHFIGHLQTNKVRYVVGRAYLIHSVDSLHLAEAIERESEKKGVISRVLVEVNVAKEDSKYGIQTEDAFRMVETIAEFPHIRVEGLMTIAPFVENQEENRQIFKKLYELSVDIGRKNIDNVHMGILSMGMTNDYETAIEEGATYIRVGTGIFGERNYNQ